MVASFGLTLLYPVLMTSARQGGERSLPALHWLVGMWGARMVSTGGFVVLAAGLYLALDGPYEFGDPWIGTSLAILIVLGGLAGGYFAPRERKLSELASRDLGGGGLSPEYETLARRVRALSWLAALLVLVALFLMVVKPGA